MSTEGHFVLQDPRHSEAAFADLSRKYMAKKKMLEDAMLAYDSLTANVEEAKSEATAAKVERYKLEAVLQQLQISVSTLERTQDALKNEETRRDNGIRKLETLLKTEYGQRDAADRRITKTARDLADDYRNYVRSCDKNSVGEELESLKVENEALNGKIENLRMQIENDSASTCSAKLCGPQDICVIIYPYGSSTDCTIDIIRQLHFHVENEVHHAAYQNGKSESDLRELKRQKEKLEDEIDNLENIWGD